MEFFQIVRMMMEFFQIVRMMMEFFQIAGMLIHATVNWEVEELRQEGKARPCAPRWWR